MSDGSTYLPKNIYSNKTYLSGPINDDEFDFQIEGREVFIATKTNTGGNEEIFTFQDNNFRLPTNGTISIGEIEDLSPNRISTDNDGTTTMNSMSGRVIIPDGDVQVTVNNDLVNSSSIIICTIASNNSANAYVKNVVAGSGSFVINLHTQAGSDLSVNFMIIN